MKTVSSFDDWLKEQKNVRWSRNPFYFHFDYNGIKCVGILTKSTAFTDVSIRPIQSIHDIGNGAGHSVIIHFEPILQP